LGFADGRRKVDVDTVCRLPALVGIYADEVGFDEDNAGVNAMSAKSSTVISGFLSLEEAFGKVLLIPGDPSEHSSRAIWVPLSRKHAQSSEIWSGEGMCTLGARLGFTVFEAGIVGTLKVGAVLRVLVSGVGLELEGFGGGFNFGAAVGVRDGIGGTLKFGCNVPLGSSGGLKSRQTRTGNWRRWNGNWASFLYFP
jgi:hypothetical protein